MAAIGRPKGQKGHNPVKHEAMMLFTKWRSEGHPMIITIEEAKIISPHVEINEGEKFSLSALALRTAIFNKKKV